MCKQPKTDSHIKNVIEIFRLQNHTRKLIGIANNNFFQVQLGCADKEIASEKVRRANGNKRDLQRFSSNSMKDIILSKILIVLVLFNENF